MRKIKSFVFLWLVASLVLATLTPSAAMAQSEPTAPTPQKIFLPLVAAGGATEELVQAASHVLIFSGYQWKVKDGTGLGPGPNNWSARSVWVDAAGDLHLIIRQINDQWYCAELTSTQAFGFGQFQWQVISRLDQLDPNVVLGLFTYPTPGVGPDGTNEIDIEVARWEASSNPPGNYTVYPAVTGRAYTTHPFAFTLQGTYTTHRFTWQSNSILFQSLNGHTDTNLNEFANWTFAPSQPLQDIPQKPVPVHMNLWLFQGHAPTNGQPVEVVIRQFKFTPFTRSPG